MKPVDPEVRTILEHAPRPINDNDPCWRGLAGYFKTVLSSCPEGWHEFRVAIRRNEDGTILLYLPTLKDLNGPMQQESIGDRRKT